MEKERKRIGLPTKMTLAVRVGVAIYLLYTVYSLRNVTSVYDGGELLFFLSVMVIFAVIAVLLIVFSVRAFATGKYVGGAMDIEEADVDKDDLEQSGKK